MEPGWSRYEAPDPIGALWLSWGERGLRALTFGGEPPLDPLLVAPSLERPTPADLVELLDRYFAGDPVEPASYPVELSGTRFQKRAWEALRAVPRGQVRSYSGIARDAGSPRSMRAIGAAMGANPIPIVVPCHRVVAAGHQLGGYTGGLERKRFLLELEGVPIHGEHVHPGQLDLL